MSEFELGILRQRAQEAYRQKVFRGEILTKVPVGYLRSSSMGGIEMTPDREVQEPSEACFFNLSVWVHCVRCSCGIIRRESLCLLRASTVASNRSCGSCPTTSICSEY